MESPKGEKTEPQSGNTSKDFEIGRGRPPKHTRWSKGQSGNPKRTRQRRPKKIVELIDEYLAREIDIVENGASRRVSVFEAICLQLAIKATAGSKRAMNILLGYQSFAASRRGKLGYEIVVVKDKEILPPPTPSKLGGEHG